MRAVPHDGLRAPCQAASAFADKGAPTRATFLPLGTGMRSFIGLPVPETWGPALMRAQARLPGGRRVDEDDLHVTLAFLGDQPEAHLQSIHEELEVRAYTAAPLIPQTWALLGAGRPRAAVLDLAQNPALTALRDTVRSAVRRAGIDLPRDRFRPHVTLLRYGRTAPADMDRLPGSLARLGTPDLTAQTARQAVLWSSVLTPGGPLYEPLAQYPMVSA